MSIGPAPKLRALVKKYCRTPILTAGQYVPVDDSERTVHTRKTLATEDELLDALELQFSALEMITTLSDAQVARMVTLINKHLRAQLPVEAATLDHDWQPTATWFACSRCGQEAAAPHIDARALTETCPGARKNET